MEGGSDVVAISELGFTKANSRTVCSIVGLDWDVDRFEPLEFLELLIVPIFLVALIVFDAVSLLAKLVGIPQGLLV